RSDGWVTAGEDATVALQVVNKGFAPAQNVYATVRSTLSGGRRNERIPVGHLGVNEFKEVLIHFRGNADTVEIKRLTITFSDDKKNQWAQSVDIPVRK